MRSRSPRPPAAAPASRPAQSCAPALPTAPAIPRIGRQRQDGAQPPRCRLRLRCRRAGRIQSIPHIHRHHRPLRQSRGARSGIVIIGNDAQPGMQESAGYLGEAVILEATSRAIDSCWVGGYFDREATQKLVRLGCNERVLAVSPLGHAQSCPRTGEKVNVSRASPAAGRSWNHPRWPDTASWRRQTPPADLPGSRGLATEAEALSRRCHNTARPYRSPIITVSQERTSPE